MSEQGQNNYNVLLRMYTKFMKNCIISLHLSCFLSALPFKTSSTIGNPGNLVIFIHFLMTNILFYPGLTSPTAAALLATTEGQNACNTLSPTADFTSQCVFVEVSRFFWSQGQYGRRYDLRADARCKMALPVILRAGNWLLYH